MIRIPYSCQGFRPAHGNHLQGTHSLSIHWHDLVWAAVSVGKLSYDDLMAHGRFSLDEVRYRSHLIYAHLLQSGYQVYRSPLYDTLDSTEKGAASYFIGMAASKLVAGSLFSVPWLVHLEKINAFRNIGLVGKSRPDLIGLTSHGEWAIFEAKGRTHGFSQHVLNKAKSQTRQVRHIAGWAPVLRVATESYFQPHLGIHLADPESFDEDAIDLKLDEAQLLATYYLTFRNLTGFLSRRESFNDHPYAFVDDEWVGLSIGINLNIFERFEREPTHKSLVDMPYSFEEVKTEDTRSTKFYPDGIAVTLDEQRWGTDIMSLEPSQRWHLRET